MLDQASRSLTLHEAAQFICRTPKPSAEQLARVRLELEHGVLQGRNDEKYGWTTSASCVAEYLARRKLHQQRAKRAAVDGGEPAAASTAHPPGSADHYRAQQALQSVYRDILKDYFLTVLMRRSLRHQSRGFQCAVVAGQFLLLAILIGGMIWSVQASLVPQPPEQKAVQEWLAKNFPDCQIRGWPPAAPAPDGRGVSVRVQFRYKPPTGKGVETERTFVVNGEQVIPVSDD